jgi:signal transduction histidine kinase
MLDNLYGEPGAHFHFFGDDADLDNRLKILIYRCAYELVNNAVKHADASNINVQLMIENGLISLSIHDDGAGFDPEKVIEGSGLENVRIRVASYNGKMNIYSSPGKGTEVSIEIEPS